MNSKEYANYHKNLPFVSNNDSYIISFLYLVQPEEFLNTDIYKIGRTTQYSSNFISRFNEYGLNLKIIYLINVETIHLFELEAKLVDKFNNNFKNYKGREYFQGDINKMKIIFLDIINEYNQKDFKNAPIISKQESSKKIELTQKKYIIDKKIQKNINNYFPIQKDKYFVEYACLDCKFKKIKYLSFNEINDLINPITEINGVKKELKKREQIKYLNELIDYKSLIKLNFEVESELSNDTLIDLIEQSLPNPKITVYENIKNNHIKKIIIQNYYTETYEDCKIYIEDFCKKNNLQLNLSTNNPIINIFKIVNDTDLLEYRFLKILDIKDKILLNNKIKLSLLDIKLNISKKIPNIQYYLKYKKFNMILNLFNKNIMSKDEIVILDKFENKYIKNIKDIDISINEILLLLTRYYNFKYDERIMEYDNILIDYDKINNDSDNEFEKYLYNFKNEFRSMFLEKTPEEYLKYFWKKCNFFIKYNEFVNSENELKDIITINLILPSNKEKVEIKEKKVDKTTNDSSNKRRIVKIMNEYFGMDCYKYKIYGSNKTSKDGSWVETDDLIQYRRWALMYMKCVNEDYEFYSSGSCSE
jgi:hypothetical protein